MTITSGPATEQGSPGARPSRLDKRRKKAHSARREAQNLELHLRGLESQLADNAAVARNAQAALAVARENVERLKRQLKGTDRERRRLIKRRKAARADLRAARRASESIERKYDRAVLDELVQREKHLVERAEQAMELTRAVADPRLQAPG